MKKEMEGILGREGTQPCVKTEDGKTRLIYNLFDGFTGKNVKITIEAMTEEEEVEGEVEWSEVEEDAGDQWEYEDSEEELESDEETDEGGAVEEEKTAD